MSVPTTGVVEVEVEKSGDTEEVARVFPAIRISAKLGAIVDQAMVALAGDPTLYCRGGELVHIVHLESTGTPIIRPVTLPTLRERLSRVAYWLKWDKGEEKWAHTLPSEPAIKAVASRGEWPGVRSLVGVTQSPLLRPDGSILQTPGYDPSTGYVYEPLEEFPTAPEAPTKEDALRARDELLEVVQDFPFATEAHRSAWLAALLTLFARPAIEGCTPFVVVDATTRGTGKGKLLDATAIIALGHEGAKIPEPADDAECRKTITSLVDAGERLAIFDNIRRPIEYASLEAVLTASMWQDRILGATRTLCAPMKTIWSATGNNVQLSGDAARRTLHVRLESPLENPEDRQDFKQKDLLAWVKKERPRLVMAALTVLRAYIVAGRPDMEAKAWGSFESWSKLVANVVRWVELQDPQNTRADLEEHGDSIREALVVLMSGWSRLDPDSNGLTAKKVIGALYPLTRPLDPDGLDDLREAVETLCPCSPGKPPTSSRLGQVLKAQRRRVIGGKMFETVGGAPGKVKRWRVVAQ